METTEGDFLLPHKKKRRFLLCLLIFLILLILLAGYFLFLLSPPSNFPANTVITVSRGESLSDLARNFKEQRLVRSSLLLSDIVILFDGEKKVVAGDYIFKEPVKLPEIARRLTEGEFGVLPLKITFQEGMNVFEYADKARSHLPKFDSAEFLALAKDKEGYLFPDTYNFLSNATAKDVFLVLESNFRAKISPLQSEIEKFGKPLSDIVTMASIIEGETKTPEARRIVSGILWKRIKLGMPLQVDSTFRYINGKNTYEITADDLKINSPYNTYKNIGLPPTAISNPGLDSILAALNPSPSKYLYFLSDRKGAMYYANTFEEHVKNRKYLNSH